MTVKSRHSQVLGAVPELETMHSLVAVVQFVAVEGVAASLVVVQTGLESIEPKLAEVGLDSAVGHWNSWGAEHVLGAAGSMMVGAEHGLLLGPMDLKGLEAWLEVVLGLLVPKGAEVELGLVTEAIHSLEPAAEAEAMKPKVVEADPVLGTEAMFVVEPDGVIVEPMVAVAGTLDEPVVPKVVVFGIFAEAAEPMVVEAESLLETAVPKEAGTAVALALEVEPREAEFVGAVAAREAEPKVAELGAGTAVALEAGARAEHVSGIVFVHEAGPMIAGLEAETVVALEAGPRVAEHVSGIVLALEAGPMMADLEAELKEGPKHS